MKERLVPLTKIGDYAPIQITKPPPFRDRLAIRIDELYSALKTARINDYDIYIRFLPTRTVIDPIPTGNWAWRYKAHDEGATSMIVAFSGLCFFVWEFPYRDDQTDSASATARLASEYVKRAIVSSPRVLQSGVRFVDRIRQKGIPTVRAYVDQFIHPDIVVEG